MRKDLKCYKVNAVVDGTKFSRKNCGKNMNGITRQLRTDLLHFNYNNFNDCKTLTLEITLMDGE